VAIPVLALSPLSSLQTHLLFNHDYWSRLQIATLFERGQCHARAGGAMIPGQGTREDVRCQSEIVGLRTRMIEGLICGLFLVALAAMSQKRLRA
jgi:hypothetical protein